MKRLFALFLLFFAATVARCAPIDTMTGIFNERVRTLQVLGRGNDIFALPVVVMGTGDELTIAFDHLETDRVYLRWRVVRCDASWQPSTLVESEYLDRFNESTVDNYRFSAATTVHYVHYDFTFPNADIHPSVSGNYLIQVYPEDNPDDVWLQVRVMLSEQSAPIDVFVTSRTDVDYNLAHQQLEVAVDVERADVANAYNDLRVQISQNGRADNEVALVHPIRMQGSRAIFEHDRKLIFDAGNEYRRFETSNVNYPGMYVEDIEYHDPYYHFTLYTDQARSDTKYDYDQTQNGRFVVREYNSADSDVDADYVVVHFSLDEPLRQGEMIFLDGDFTQRRFDDASRMFYNHTTGRYEKAVLLKQGHYNYQYLAVPPGALGGLTGPVEGNYYNTANEYVVKVYTRGPLDRTDRLIGVTRIISQ